MRGDIHHNKIIRSLWGNSHTELFLWPFGDWIAVCVGVSISISLHLSMFWMCPLCLQGNNSICAISPFDPIVSSSCICIFIPFSLFWVSWFALFPTMWWCLHPDAGRRKRFRGCVTACPLTTSLYSSHLTVLMGFAPPLHSAHELNVL